MFRPLHKFLRDKLLHNLGLKLLSLALAVGLWLALAGEPLSEVAVDVPIAMDNMPANLDISSVAIPKAQVRLRGPERIIRGLQPSDVFAEIDLNGVKPGERTFDLKVHRPRNLTIVQVVPGNVHLAFDVHLTRTIPVQPRVIASFGNTYQIGRIQSEPATVNISGPKQHVEAIESATTDAIDVNGESGIRTFVRNAYVSDPLVQVAGADPVRITVTIEKIPSNGH
ncbi:MAG TPA: CdaR family protein [Terriglobales bacterium]|nr:CdaR family protein [Terriglobales bacterium]